MRRRLAFISLIGLVASHGALASDDALVAVASNFAATAKELAAGFNETSGHRIRLSFGSTGKLYAQITNGAPYDVFLSADSERPVLLEEQGGAVAGSRFTYAVGALLLWSRNTTGDADACVDALLSDQTARIAIANPKIAPYGVAAKEYLLAAGLWEGVASRLIVGENIAQTFQFVSEGGAAFGFIAAAQSDFLPHDACTWQVPATLYTPIRQQAVLLQRGEDNAAATAFMAYLRAGAEAIIVSRGYSLAPSDE